MIKFKHVKTGLLIFLLILVGVIGFKGYEKIKRLNADNLVLTSFNKKLTRSVELLTEERDNSYSLIDALDNSYHVLELDLEESNKIIKELRDSLKAIPDAIAKIPPTETYKYLQARYESEGEKEFKFSAPQIGNIHNDVVVGDLLADINLKLTDSNSILKSQISNRQKVEEGLRDVIESYKGETKLLYDANSDLTKQNIKVKTQRNGAVIVIILEAIAIGILIVV